MRIRSSDDFSPLKSVVVGTATHANLASLSDPSNIMNFFPGDTAEALSQIPTGSLTVEFVAQANELIAEFVKVLENAGVTVYRPEELDFTRHIQSVHGWQTSQFNGWSPRDHVLVVDNMLVQCPTPTRSRQQEVLNLYSLLMQREDALWVSAPTPPLTDDLYDFSDFTNPRLTSTQIAFEAANVLRVGTHAFYQSSVSGNIPGYQWLKTILALKGVTLHLLENVYSEGVHIDSTLWIPKPGLIVVNPDRLDPNNLPEPLDEYFGTWDKIVPEIVAPQNPPAYALSSKWLGMNNFSITPELAVVDAKQDDLCRQLSRHGIEPVRLSLDPVCQVLGGGFHCTTLDLEREGGLQDYFG